MANLVKLLLLGAGGGGGSGGGGPADPHWSSVKLLLGFNGANGATSGAGFTDESSAARGAATVVDNAQISTAQSKFGGSSLLLDGDGDYITFPDSNDWDFGTGPFTIEGFFWLTGAKSLKVLIQQGATGWRLVSQGGTLYFHSGSGADTSYVTWSPSLNAWHHVAIDRDASSVARIYIDGVLHSSTAGYTANLGTSTAVLEIGSRLAEGVAGWDLNAYVDEIRITKGVARYGSDSGFAVPTAAFPRS